VAESQGPAVSEPPGQPVVEAVAEPLPGLDLELPAAVAAGVGAAAAAQVSELVSEPIAVEVIEPEPVVPELMGLELPSELAAILAAGYVPAVSEAETAAAIAPEPSEPALNISDDLAAALAAAEEAEESDASPVAEAAPEAEETAAPNMDLSDDLAAALAAAEAVADEATVPKAAAEGGPGVELDEELRKFLEREGTSLEEVDSEEDGKDDEPPTGAAGGGEGDKDGDEELTLVLDDDEDGGGGSKASCEETPAPNRAPFWVRALAFGVDSFLLLVLSLASAALAAAAFIRAAGGLGDAADLERLLILAVVLAGLALPVAAVALGLAYFTSFHGLVGSTPGKMLFGLEVRGADGLPLGCGRAFLRSVSYLLSAIPASLGFLWATGRDRLAWHDLIAESQVLRAS
jgi:uncharacterized RDD family membrane protein YckC